MHSRQGLFALGPRLARPLSRSCKNVGKGPAVMPPTMPTLGRYWVGVWDPFTSPGVMPIAAGPPPQLLPGKATTFVLSLSVRLRAGPPAGGPGYAVFVQADQQI